MKVLNSSPISSFGGLNFVLEEFNNMKIEKLFNDELPCLPAQSVYSWKDIFFSYWSIILCGGDCAEDLSTNLKHNFANNPLINTPSPDRLLSRLKMLSEEKVSLKKNRSKAINEFSFNPMMNKLNLKVLKRLNVIPKKDLVLDYDNTFIYADKADAKRTYTKGIGYCPGVATIGSNTVFVENRNGNCAPHTMQDDTFERMFEMLQSEDFCIASFRADSASYQLATIATVRKYTNRFYIRATMSETINQAIQKIDDWKEVKLGDGRVLHRGSVKYTPFKSVARKLKRKDDLCEYRLVVTKEARDDGQLNMFTNEACNYGAIVTNDFEGTDDEITIFYNQRGKQEREFDILKNDFAWDKMPFSKMEHNTVFLLLMAMCRNLYNYIINKFSKHYKGLSPNYRLKKFIFRFICIPTKWIKTGREYKLRLYGNLAFKT